MLYKSVSTILCIFLLLASSVSASFSWYDHASLKLTIETVETLYEWEYENPDSFEYEKGNEIIRGEEARKSFKEVLQFLILSKPRIDGETIERLERNGFPKITKVVIYSTDRNYSLKTWIWKPKD
ncbi:MAG: hypothetical protein LRY73_01385 [Bacillus sp. (in: Bacteria)]|nr:hypothetical protein [Bacillus sp. (in: firmicutes)]